MDRRGFLGVMLAAASAPAIVKAESLMKIVVPKRSGVIYVPMKELITFGLDIDGDVVFGNDGPKLVLPDHHNHGVSNFSSLTEFFTKAYNDRLKAEMKSMGDVRAFFTNNIR